MTRGGGTLLVTPAPLVCGMTPSRPPAQANIGEVLEGRYKILGTSGRGVFSTVLICEDLKDLCRVAIKVIKTNETMRRAGEKELELLEVGGGGVCPAGCTVAVATRGGDHTCACGAVPLACNLRACAVL